MITIRKPLSFSRIGRKSNQEDCIYPAHLSSSDSVFILCDGMGGHERGEVAARTVAETMGAELSAAAARGTYIDPVVFCRSLGSGYDALDRLPVEDPKRKPGTTLTCLCLNSESYLAAHIGDSRIYHIRPSLFDPVASESGIIYRSEDHSLVRQLVRTGQITEEEARTHPRRNVITRAMQPQLETRFNATVLESDDILPGDYFFLCSDGVLEQLTDRRLCEILAEPGISDTEKLQAILAECDRGTNDNHTCILVPVEDVTTAGKPRSSSQRKYIVPLVILIVIALAAVFGIISYYFDLFGTKTPAPVVADTTVIETIAEPDTIVLEQAVIPAPDTMSATAAPAAEMTKPDSMHQPAAVPAKEVPATDAAPEKSDSAPKPAKEEKTEEPDPFD